MARLERLSLDQVIGQLPDVESLVMKSRDDADDYLFLCALGFESRCLSIPQKLADQPYKCRQAVYFRYDRNQADNEVNLAPLEKYLRRMTSSVDALDAVLPDFGNRLRTVLSGLAVGQPAGSFPRVTMDISVMTNWLVLVCLKVLLEFDVQLRVVYSEADIYHPTREEYQVNRDGWKQDDAVALERGVLAVTVSPEHQGQHLDPIPDCVVLFPSFRKDRSRAIITHVDPTISLDHGTRVVWLLGVPHLEENHWRVDAMRYINELDKENVPQYQVSTFDYRETISQLEAIYQDRWQDYKITVAPLGSKLQALGTGLFVFLHPDVRLLFAIPNEYNAQNYSGGCREHWQVNFRSLTTLRETLGKVGTLMIENGY